MKLGLNLRLSQSIKLTPLLQQSIKLLHASQSELNDLIEEYLSDNTFLKAKDTTLLSNWSFSPRHYVTSGRKGGGTLCSVIGGNPDDSFKGGTEK